MLYDMTGSTQPAASQTRCSLKILHALIPEPAPRSLAGPQQHRHFAPRYTLAPNTLACKGPAHQPPRAPKRSLPPFK